MKILLIPLLLLIYSCSSTGKKYPFETIESKTNMYQDALTRTNIMTTVYPGIPVIADKYLKSGRINRDNDKSCYKDGGSVNYVNISHEYVPLFRPFTIEINKSVVYRNTAGYRNSIYARLYTEQTKDQLQIQTKICFMDIDLGKGVEHVMVVSELYSENGKKQ